MTRNLLLALALWAAIYLPSLGSLEIKGEEGRRILPAVTMLNDGNYLVPQVGSEPYLRKPPLVNWLIATSFRLFGHRNEWTARLPSALCVLVVALVFISIARAGLGRNGALIAPIIWLTNFGMIEKGRLIEIEALYTSLFGLAFICWVSWWQEKRSPWLTWIVPFIFLGLGLLAKGPLHLFFFYALVVAILWHSGELRELVKPAHFVGVALMLGIFAAWAIPYFHAMHGTTVVHAWSRQFSGRLAGEDFQLHNWLLNIPRALAYFLPWLLFLPLACHPQLTQRRESLSRGLKWGIAVPFLLINLIPGALPRYVMPLLVPAAWWLAMTFTDENLRWPDWLGGRALPKTKVDRWIAGLAITTAVALCLYAVAIVPKLQKRDKVRTIATQIDAVIPSSQILFAVDPDYQPFLFYVRRSIVYVSRVADLPQQARYFLVQPQNEAVAEQSKQWDPRRARVLLRIKDYRNRASILFDIEPLTH